jgi:kynureninase
MFTCEFSHHLNTLCCHNARLQVWELVPAALQDALGPLIGEKQGEVEANPEVTALLHSMM